MADTIRKAEAIRQIEYLQLSVHLIHDLEDEIQAECVAHAIASLQDLAEQWN